MARKFVAQLMMAMTAIVTPAMAAAEGALQVSSQIFVEQRSLGSDGTVRTKLVPASHAVPGDHVVFVLAYKNNGSQPLQQLVLNNPVPGALTYRAPGNNSAAPDLSIDGKTFGSLEQLRVVVAGGNSRAANSADVRHVRWRVASLPAGGQGQVAFKAVLK